MADGDRLEEEYRSVASEAEVEVVRRRSRFFAIVAPVEDGKEAEGFLERVRSRHPDASHHCYAYRAGRPSPVVRMSDDGEPGGTAGRPILDVIERNSLENTAVAVVRYFGGTLLGAGGLTRAYSAAASEGIAAAGISTYVSHALLEVEAGYKEWARVEAVLDRFRARALQVEYGASVRADVAVREESEPALRAAVRDAAAGAAVVRRKGSRYMPVP